GETVDQRADLFSLGCVLYQLSTGELPFKGADAISTLVAVATECPPPPGALNPSLPQAFSDLVMQLLAKDPADRTASALAVVQALRAIERKLPSRADGSGATIQVGTQEGPRPAAARGRRWAVGALVALLLAALGIAGYFYGRVVLRIVTDKG